MGSTSGQGGGGGPVGGPGSGGAGSGAGNPLVILAKFAWACEHTGLSFRDLDARMGDPANTFARMLDGTREMGWDYPARLQIVLPLTMEYLRTPGVDGLPEGERLAGG